MKLECDGHVIPLPSLQGIVVLNIPRWVPWAGTDSLPVQLSRGVIAIPAHKQLHPVGGPAARLAVLTNQADFTFSGGLVAVLSNASSPGS